MDTQALITQLLAADTAPEQCLAAARQLSEAYPFFLLPSVVMLRRCAPLLDPQELEMLRLKVALADPDHSALFNILSARATEFRNFYPPEELPGKPSTEDAIDTFLQRYASSTDSRKETELLERLIFNPVPEYASVLEQQEDALPAQPANLPQRNHVPQPSPDSLLSETLAKFHIRRHQYDKALEIISNLVVTHPQKAHHYHTQIRFLRKLIKNRQLLTT